MVFLSHLCRRCWKWTFGGSFRIICVVYFLLIPIVPIIFWQFVCPNRSLSWIHYENAQNEISNRNVRYIFFGNFFTFWHLGSCGSDSQMRFMLVLDQAGPILGGLDWRFSKNCNFCYARCTYVRKKKNFCNNKKFSKLNFLSKWYNFLKYLNQNKKPTWQNLSSSYKLRARWRVRIIRNAHNSPIGDKCGRKIMEIVLEHSSNARDI